MNDRTPLWDILTKPQRDVCIENIIAHFLDERSKEIGVIAAGEILDAVVKPITHAAYNKGVTDTKALFEERYASMLADVDVLRKE
jgi:uncharacterized protein (DUF2164 family)